jgi:hypothetical protein
VRPKAGLRGSVFATAGIVLVALAIAGWASELDLLDDLRIYSHRRTLEGRAFGSRDLTRVLGGLGAVHSRPRLEPPDVNNGSGPVRQAFSLDEIPIERLSRELEIDQEWIIRGAPTVSLQLDPEDLRALNENLMERGREWEFPANFSWVEEGRVRFASKVGCRIHGAGGRRTGLRYGHRIYFRRSYGAAYLPRELLDTGGRLPAKRVVLRADGGKMRGWAWGGVAWYFTDAMTRDIARRIGLPAPRSTPAAIFVNGELVGVRDVVERIDAKFLVSHFSHDDFVLARTKRTRGEPRNPVKMGPFDTYAKFDEWARDGRPIQLADVKSRVDVDNLIRWILLVQIAAVRDSNQGTALFDLSHPDPRWFWVPWDLNVSLGVNPKPKVPYNARYITYFASRSSASRDGRTSLVNRLLGADPEFRTAFVTTFDEIYNHRLTPDFVNELLAAYEAQVRRFGLDTTYLGLVREFLMRREAILRGQLEATLELGPTYPVIVHSPPGAVILIDGHPHTGTYRGEYFEGSRLTLQVEAEPGLAAAGSKLEGWLPAGQIIETSVDGPMRITLSAARGVAG